jgi:rhodanese-related sulfurtransferase
LFTIPTDREIIIYSYNGQRSAYITAYLNLLGYNARFISFGAHSMLSLYYMSWEIHGRVDDPKNTLDTVYYRSEFAKYAFWEENIRNYSVEIGQ